MAAELQRVPEVGDREGVGAGLAGQVRGPQQTEPVAVAFQRCEDPGGRADEAADGLDVMGDRVGVHLDAVGPREAADIARNIGTGHGGRTP